MMVNGLMRPKDNWSIRTVNLCINILMFGARAQYNGWWITQLVNINLHFLNKPILFYNPLVNNNLISPILQIKPILILNVLQCTDLFHILILDEIELTSQTKVKECTCGLGRKAETNM
jgi:hypothetical protein